MSARQAPVTSSRSRLPRWIAGVGVAAAVVAVVVAVQAVAGGADESAGGTAAGVSSAPTDALVAQLFGAAASVDSPADVTRTTSDDVAAGWPVAGCAAAAPAEAGRADFVSGTERGPEYSRDLAIGWYEDAAAARKAYDAVVARIAACAAEAGSRLTTSPAALGDVGSVSVVGAGEAGVDADAAEGAVGASLAAVTQSGSVVVLAVDHASFYGAPPAESTARTTAQAERLLTDACAAASADC